jgi:hypothetical protein
MDGGGMKAADIGDARMLEVVREFNDAHSLWCLTYHLEECLPDFPPKVILAKARQLIKRRLMDGCGCGCRGDFEILPAGRELLDKRD